jgi:hypothetical protein
MSELNDLKIINIGWLIDGSGDPVRKNVQLRVVGGHIDAVVKNSPRKSDSRIKLFSGFPQRLPCRPMAVI